MTNLEAFDYAMKHFEKILIEYIDGKPYDTSSDRWQQAPDSRYFIDMKAKTIIFVFSLDDSPLPKPPFSMKKIERNNLTIVTGKPIRTLAMMQSKGKKPDKTTGDLTLKENEVEAVLENFNKISATLGVSTHKLFIKAISDFTTKYHNGDSDDSEKVYHIALPLKEYAVLCGEDVEEHPTNTPEEAELEKKRVKNTLDNFRKKVKKNIQLLLSFRIEWEEKIKGKLKVFDSMNVLGRGTIKNGMIDIEFTGSMANYLLQLPLTQYPVALFALDDRSSNAYAMGFKMAEHYNNDNNLISGTANLLRVKSLLKATNFPSIDEVRKNDNGGWDRLIKEPFESALDVLTQNGILSDWRYSHSKGKEMTDTEATNFQTFEEWADTLIYFELKDPVDHTERLAKIAEKKKKAKVKKDKKKANE